MARTRKYTVEYFPHHCKNGKVVTILENRWGNEGYAFFYRLLQLLGDSEGHFIDCRNQDDWEYLVARMRVSEEIAEAILAKLSDLRVIDRELWDLRVIWDQDFVDDLTEVYRKRRTDLPQKPDIRHENDSEGEFPARESADNDIPDPEMRQSKVKESKVNNNILKEPVPDGTTGFAVPSFEDISLQSDPALRENIKKVSEQLYREGIFREVHAFVNKMLKQKKNPRAILHTLSRCYLSHPEDPWPYCQNIMANEHMTYNAKDYERGV